MGNKEIMLVLSMLLMISSSKGVNEFNYYQVVLQWQPATCSSASLESDCVKTPTDRYSIHGVWPSLSSSANSPTCSGTPSFDINQISTIRTRLNTDWPSVVYGANPTLWSHEWTSHGTCSYEYLNQLQYFTFGLDTYSQYNMLSILSKNDIYPDVYPYSRSEVTAAIKSETGKLPALRCNINYWSNEKQLHEIVLCFTKADRALQNCPLNADTCDSSFYWYSWDQNVAVSHKTNRSLYPYSTASKDVV